MEGGRGGGGNLGGKGREEMYLGWVGEEENSPDKNNQQEPLLLPVLYQTDGMSKPVKVFAVRDLGVTRCPPPVTSSAPLKRLGGAERQREG